MKTVVYINNDQVSILAGKKYLEFPLPQGSVSNGVLINRDAILQVIRDNRKLLRRPLALLNSSNAILKAADHPPMSKRQFRSYLEQEAGLPPEGEMGEEIRQVKIPGGRRSYFQGVPKDLLESYVSLFREAGVSLQGILSLQLAAEDFLAGNKGLRGQTCFLEILEGENLLSILFDQGAYVLTDRSRLLGEPGSPAWEEELAQKISYLIQFDRSRKSPNPLSAMYFSGFQKEGLEFLRSRFPGLLIEAAEKAAGIPPAEGNPLPCLLGLAGKGGEELLRSARRRKRKLSSREILLLAAAFSLFLSAGGYFLSRSRTLSLEEENRALREEISTSKDGDKLEELLSKQSLLARIPRILEELEAARGEGAPFEALTRDTLLLLIQKAGNDVLLERVEGEGETGTVILQGVGTSEFSASRYVGALKDTGLFSQVEYSGYESSRKGEYSFLALCTLR